jgi:hypothetical protein
VVGLLRSGKKRRFFKDTGTPLGMKLTELYDFLAEAQGDESDLVLNAERLGIVHGALLAFATDVELDNSRNAQSLTIAVEIGTKFLAAPAQVSNKALGGPAGINLVAAVEASSKIIDAAVSNKSSKLKRKTKSLAVNVVKSFERTVKQNVNARYIPGYY